MKAAIISTIGIFATMANAYNYPRRFNFRRGNSTEPLTTLTVQTTVVETVTSCKPTVTDCAGRPDEQTAVIVTNTVVLTETVCPVSDAPAISSSVISDAGEGKITGTTLTTSPTVSVPLGTGATTPDLPTVTLPNQTGGGGEVDDHMSTVVSETVQDETLTMTLGTGSLTSVVTTTIKTTIRQTHIVTMTLPGDHAASGEGNSPTGADSSSDATTTITSTSTGYTTVTVKHPSATETVTVPEQEGDGGVPDGSDDDDSCACPDVATVTLEPETVYMPASTVYVTVTPGGNKPVTGSTPTPAADEDDGLDEEEYDEEDDEDDGEDDACPPEESTITMSKTVTVVPYPTNGTATASGSAEETGSYYYKRDGGHLPLLHKRNH